MLSDITVMMWTCLLTGMLLNLSLSLSLPPAPGPAPVPVTTGKCFRRRTRVGLRSMWTGTTTSGTTCPS
jgi:hypothetical protein